MKKLLLWLTLSFCALGQTLPWTGNSSKAWLAQSPNALSIPKAGTYISLSNQTNRLSMSGGRLLLDGVPIGGPTIYTGNGTFLGNRQVDGNNFALDFVNMNNVTINPKGTDFSAGSISGSAANNTRRATLNAGLVRLNATTNVMINEYSLITPNGAGIIFDSVSNSPASSDEILFRDPSTHIVKWGSAYTAADVGGSGGANFANTDLTFTGTRIHDVAGNILTIHNASTINLSADSGAQLVSQTTGGSIYIDSNEISLTVNDTGKLIKFATSGIYDGIATAGQVPVLNDSSNGTWEWSDPPAGPNFANADLTFTGNRSHSGAGFDFQLLGNGVILIESTNSAKLSVNDGVDVVGFNVPPVSPLQVQVLTHDVSQGVIDTGWVLTSQDTSGTSEWKPLPFPLNGVPTVAAGAGAGGSPTVALANETDSAFTLSVIAGTTPATDDDIAVITFSSAYATAPHFSLSAANKAAANLSGSSAVWATSTTTDLTVHSNTTGLVDGTTYVFEVIVVR